MSRELVLTMVALALALGIGVAVGAWSERSAEATAATCAVRAGEIVSRYRGQRAGGTLSERRLMALCLDDPAAFARLVPLAAP